MILCLGTTPAIQRSMSFERITHDGVNRTSDVQQYASGKSINAARVLHTLECSPLAIGFAGGDSGRFLLEDLERAGIASDFVTVAAPTRMCITIVDRQAGTATELIEESKAIEPAAYLCLHSEFLKHLPNAIGVVLSGSLPPLAITDFYADCVDAAVKAKKFVVLDATGEPLRRALPRRPTIVKPNRTELSQTVNLPVETDAQLKKAIKTLLFEGPHWAVITNGAKETIISDGVAFWKLCTPKVKVISAIGSGDSFTAGLAAGIAAGQEVPEACRLGVACGAANAMTPRAGHVTKSDVEAILKRVTISKY